MEEKLKSYLRDGERVLWQSRPQDFPLLDCNTKTKLILRWIITPVCAVSLAWVYLSHNVGQVSSVFLAMIALITAGLVFAPAFERRTLAAQRFWITDQRAIVRTGGEFYCMELAELDQFEVLHGLAEYDCIVLGSSLFAEIAKKLRWQGCHPVVDEKSSREQGHCSGMVFYCPQHAEEAAALLERACTRGVPQAAARAVAV